MFRLPLLHFQLGQVGNRKREFTRQIAEVKIPEGDGVKFRLPPSHFRFIQGGKGAPGGVAAS
ncbi:MAG: hypothetical protein HRU41_36430 [Saprospiraceae bacterium]|nr:hypothetical protein [Saprospiraceae bacterium]